MGSHGVIIVEGMTCNSCVQSIEAKIGEMRGLDKITVSLARSSAEVYFQPTVLSLELIREAIDDMGFDARIPDRVQFGVEGMTCGSCVRSITEKLLEAKGVLAAHVSLENKSALVEFDSRVILPSALATIIDDAGFDVSQPQAVPSHAAAAAAAATTTTTPAAPSAFSVIGASSSLASAASGASRAAEQAVTIHVEGMTCGSCVKSIEEKIGAVPGIKKITVSLADKAASVLFTPAHISAEEIRAAIDDMGFDATLPAGTLVWRVCVCVCVRVCVCVCACMCMCVSVCTKALSLLRALFNQIDAPHPWP
jgi:P-type Cu+ transporter